MEEERALVRGAFGKRWKEKKKAWFLSEGRRFELEIRGEMKRYTTAMRNEKPDRVPIRPFAAEFTAKYAGYTCQEVTHDYEIRDEQ